MVYCFYGENTYLIKKKIGQLRERFVKEFGDTDIVEAKGEDLDRATFSNLVFSVPFFSSKRLIIIRNLLLENSDDLLRKFVLDSLDKIPKTTVLVIVEMGNPDNRTALFKALNQPKIAIKFGALIGAKLNKWIIETVLENGGNIAPDVADKLQIYAGGDLNRLENEIEKLVLYQLSKESSEILISDIKELVDPVISPNIFDFISALAIGNIQRSIKILTDLQKSGENDLKILSMIIYQFKTMLIVSDLMSRGFDGSKITNISKIHPFVVRKTIELLKHYDHKKLIENYLLIQQTDYKIKSGKVDSLLALNLLVANLNNQLCTVSQ